VVFPELSALRSLFFLLSALSPKRTICCALRVWVEKDEGISDPGKVMENCLLMV
jgi:hypothetical protein